MFSWAYSQVRVYRISTFAYLHIEYGVGELVCGVSHPLGDPMRSLRGPSSHPIPPYHKGDPVEGWGKWCPKWKVCLGLLLGIVCSIL